MPTPRSLISPVSSFLVPLFLAALTGCSGRTPVGLDESGFSARGGSKVDPADAAGFGSGTFYPLSVGNSWAYRGGGQIRVIQDGVPTEPDFTYDFTEARQLIGTTNHEGTTYVVEEQVHHEIPEGIYGPFTWWVRLRQDANGLFALDTLLNAPPVLEGGRIVTQPAEDHTNLALRASLAAIPRTGSHAIALEHLADRMVALREVARRGVGRNELGEPTGLELRQLVYPLRVGLSWSTRPDFPWPARVDRVEILNTPAGRKTAYRIDINPGGTAVNEGEWVRVWYSREGYLGYSIHLSSEVTNENGEPTGEIFVADESMTVTSINIVQ